MRARTARYRLSISCWLGNLSSFSGLAAVHAAKLGGRERVHARDLDQRFDRDLFAFGVARAAGGPVIYCLTSEAAEHARVGAPDHHFALGRCSHHSLMIPLDGVNHLVIFINLRAG